MRLDVESLAFGFSEEQMLFTDLSFTASGGELVAITGPSGSGKSTLLSIIAGWVSPVSGTVTSSRGARVTWVFQNPVGVARRTALDHVVLPMLARGSGREAANLEALEVLERFSLVDASDRKFEELSGGQAQRLMLARAVATRPNILLIDEPTAQLDPMSSATVARSIGQVVQDDCIAIVATHDPLLAEQAGRVISLGLR